MKKIGFISLLACVFAVAIAQQPNWWSEYSLVNAQPRKENALATIGQAKHAVKTAYLYLDETLTAVGGAGEAVSQLYATYCTVPPVDFSTDSVPLTLGQLKFLAKPFYDRLNSSEVSVDTTGMNPSSTDIYPWTISQDDDADTAPATLGQLKFVFSFDLSEWSAPETSASLSVMPDSISVALSNTELFTLPVKLMNTGSDAIDYALEFVGHVPIGSQYYEALTSYWDGVEDGFFDISSTGTELNTLSTADDAVEAVGIPFKFSFFGEVCPQVFVATNGIVSFRDDSLLMTAKELYAVYGPNHPNLNLAPFMCDLDPSASSDARILYEVLDDPLRMVIQYDQVPHAVNGGAYTFQIVIHRSGEIYFYYDEMLSGSVEHDWSTFYENGDGSSWGLQAYRSNGFTSSFSVQDGSALYLKPNRGFVFAEQSYGAIDAGGEESIRITFDPYEVYDPGVYEAILSVLNTTDNSILKEIPVTMEIVNAPPVITFNTPASDFKVASGLQFKVEVSASDSDYWVDQVEFLLNGEIFAEDTWENWPDLYDTYWTTPTEPGTYALAARVTDGYGLQTTTEPVLVTVYEDMDDDEMDDVWELDHFGDLQCNAFDDFDNDGMPNIYEFNHGTVPTNSERLEFASNQENDGPGYFVVDSTVQVETNRIKRTPVAAIEAARDYDVIEIKAGLYQVPIGVISKRLFIFSSDGARSTVFDYEHTNVDNEESILEIYDECLISGITIRNSSGGGVYISAPLAKNGVSLSGCRILNNTGAYTGGGIYLGGGKLALINCTIADNEASYGQSIYASGSSAYPSRIDLINSIAWDAPGDGDESIYLSGTYASLLSDHSILGSYVGEVTGNFLSVDPQFGFDYSLTAHSPAVNAGSNVSTVYPDCDEELPEDGVTDIGADEFIDSDGDQLPDWLEAIVPEGLLANDDYDGDGLANLDEYELYRTDLRLADTDSDLVSDSFEIFLTFTDPLDFQSVGAMSEVYPYDSQGDFDSDGLSDTWEYYYGFDPFKKDGTAALDPDHDLRPNLLEYLTYTDPFGYDLEKGQDTDRDGMSDLWEFLNGLSPDQDDGDLDSDDDLLTNYEEFILGSDPNASDENNNGLLDGHADDDADGDGIPNQWEQMNGLNFIDDTDSDHDMDEDGLSAYWEWVLGYNPQKAVTYFDSIRDGDRDYDGDKMIDSWEVVHGLNPTLNDSNLDPDEDGLTNLEESLLSTHPQSKDTDGDSLSDAYEDEDQDGIPNGWELRYEMNPFDSSDAYMDTDSDGLTNLQEYRLQSNPLLMDSDGDGLSDPNEDSDGDGLPNLWELISGLDPIDPVDATSDLDGDSLSNLDEFQSGTNSLLWDTDSDGIADGDVDEDLDLMGDDWEQSNGFSSSDASDGDLDSDGDGVSNRDEYANQTNPLAPDAKEVSFEVYTELE